MLWIIPSLTVLLIKIFLFFQPVVRKQKYLLFFLISTFFLSIFELIGFFRLGYDLLVLKLYYCTAIFTVLHLALISAEIARTARFLRAKVLLFLAFSLTAIILFSNRIVADYTIMPNSSITRVTGDLYYIFQIYALTLLIVSLAILIKSTVEQRETIARKRCIIVLIALCPAIVAAVVVMCLMEMGFQINMAVILSVTICFMLLIFRGNYDEHDVFRTMKYIPFSSERAFYLKLKSLSKKLSLPATGESVNIKEALKEVEELVVKNANQYFDTQKEVAKALNISESSLSRKLPKK
ncbi:histidine kinase N-terminal 7TM domain-containing protein [Marinomonas balearica]|uniref:Histidine kinase-like protein n=1 Tax=Marinomonas balearica TaxID=491947 RepID=A0A4R6M785_9GAMM|nr:histidine kinase N-terminal 7TM domain-containing protein [Marinomonas balearica]TDO97278.1 histidine kinase-like protein [Marinomonas balearica]